MKKRRYLPWFLAVTLLVAGGCGKEDPVAVEEPEIVIEEVLEEEESIEEMIPMAVHTQKKEKTYYLEAENIPYFYLEYCDVSVEGSQFEKLKRMVENWSVERNENLRSVPETVRENAIAEIREEKEFYGYTLYQDVAIARSDEHLLSLVDSTYQYSGGGHQIFVRDGVNFDAQSGKRLELRDIVTDFENFQTDANEKVISVLEECYESELYKDYAETVDAMWQDDKEPSWYMDATGIVIVLPESLVGPRSVGTPEIHLSYQEFERYIKEDYLPGINDSVARIAKNEEAFLELGTSGKQIPMMLEYQWEDYLSSCTFWLGEEKVSVSDFATLEEAYLIRTNGEVYCLMEMDMASDDYVTLMYRLTSGVIQEVDQLNAAIDEGNINPNEIVMETWVYLLGTYGGIKTYHFAENHGFITEDQEFILHNNEFVLTTVQDLTVILDGQEAVLPTGSHMILNATDNESYVKFTIPETGQTGMLEVVRGEESYTLTINGVNEYECFEILPYAG